VAERERKAPVPAPAKTFFGFLRHSKGEWAGQTFALASWQAFVVGSLFGWQRSDGLRRFRTAYCAVPRKNGKSTLSAGIGLYLLVADGEQGAEIYSAATSRDQARIVFDEAKRMVGASPALKRRVSILINNLHVAATTSRFMPLSSDASTMDGLNVHGAIIDELHGTRPATWSMCSRRRHARRHDHALPAGWHARRVARARAGGDYRNKAAGQGLKTALHRQVGTAGLGQRLANSWRDKHYPNQRLDAATLVYTNAPQIIRAFDEGAVIRSRRGRFLAIPTENAPRKGTDGRQIKPSTFP
jgi:hypothetical protein